MWRKPKTDIIFQGRDYERDNGDILYKSIIIFKFTDAKILILQIQFVNKRKGII